MPADVLDETSELEDGIALHRQGRFAEARTVYERCLESPGDQADAMHLLGVIAHQEGNHRSAISWIRRAVALKPGAPAFHSNLGIAHRALGDADEALAALRRACELDENSAGVRYNLANVLQDAGRYEDAAAEFRASLDRDAQNADAWTGLGDALRWLNDHQKSRRCHQRAIDLCPRLAAAHYNLGQTLKDEERLAEAAACFLRSAILQPDMVDAHVNLGNAYEDLGRFDQAIAAYDRALRLSPHLALAQFNRSLALLRKGELAAGWDEYESRWRNHGKRRIFSKPEWDGTVLSEKTILIYSEQGIGDEILFASCFQETIERYGQCLIECERRLVPLFARSFPSACVFERAAEVDPADVRERSPWDVQIATGSLPRLLRRSFSDFPAYPGYLQADPEQVRVWRERYDRLEAGLVVGISWKGGQDPTVRRRRSTSLEQWAPLLRIPGIAFVNLQYGDTGSDIEHCHQQLGATIHHWEDSDPLKNVDHFAAQIAALDLVISVDNSTVHLAGALNVPVWTLLPAACDWRWFHRRSDTPWYPSMRLFRPPDFGGATSDSTVGRTAPEAWNAVFQDAATSLDAFAQTRAVEEHRAASKLHTASRLAEAIQHYQRAAWLRPDGVAALNDLGVAWKDAGRPDLAVHFYKRVIEAQPTCADAWFNLGNVLREENRLDEAISAYERALQLTPHEPRMLVNLSVALRDRRRLDAAMDCLATALQRNPELPEARFDRSLIALLRGDYGQGWDEYEWRFLRNSNEGSTAPNRWQGESLADRSILISAEQGIGDQVMFASCIGRIAAAAKNCMVECDPRLITLLSRSFPQISTIPATDRGSTGPLRPRDLFVPIGSLPRHLRRQPADFPQHDGYLKPEEAAVDKWRLRFARLGSAMKIGIAWRGGKDAETQRQRSIPLDLWRPLFQVPGVRFVNLQHGPVASDAVHIRDRFNISIDDGTDCDPLTDLDDFAAKIAALDLVVSVDNSTVHLAGAVGCQVWTLLPFSSDWRWLLEGETTPWYPSMRLLRCSTPDAWDEVLQRAARRLTSLCFSRQCQGLSR